ncbi:hypothetical protein [Bradyrhizobium sp.]|uniref:hypothetical protein n=1 Tax=Bradyrhizobium sp. TaxID=376 RepID=UPI0039E600F3
MAGRRSTWLACLITLVGLLAFANLTTDAALDVKYGWDVRVNCAAVDAHVAGLDPYFVKNLKGTRLSYPYLPVTLDVFRPLCTGGFLVVHFRMVFVALAVLCGLLLPGLGGARNGPRDIVLRLICVFGAFVGFEWVSASGNFAILSGLLTAAALALLLRSGVKAGHDDRSFLANVAGAALLGLVMSFKLVFCPVLAALYLLPQPRRRKLILIAAAGLAFALPILISMIFYADLFSSWLLAIKGQIPNQHSVYLEETNPSLLLLVQSVADRAGLGENLPVVFAMYGLSVLALVLGPFALLAWRTIRSGEGWLLARLDRWLVDHPRMATRLTVLAMYALYLCSPRLKEYAFFELAIYAAILIVDLSPLALAAVLVVGIGVPSLMSLTGNAFEGGFGLLAIALVCFWILLFDFRPARMRLLPEAPLRN